MHRSSDSIGKIAAALALAQQDLYNPERTQVAALPTAPGGQRSFRYASLAAGLDIIRKVLGEHEIATVQSTALDHERGLIRLNTVLAHSSGEWIASEWPVCATSEVNVPHRLGSALTYARRYALFTLVGIAGDDDLDAPDLHRTPPTAKGSRTGASAAYSMEESAAACKDLLAELARLATTDDLTRWSLRRLMCRRRLQPDDAEKVDRDYLDALDRIENPDAKAVRPPAKKREAVALQKSVRYRSKDHLVFVAAQPCMLCEQTPCDAHHLKFAQPRALGKKVSDEFTVPLCRVHHAELHRNGDERAWWANAGLSPMERAAELWQATRSGRATAATGA